MELSLLAHHPHLIPQLADWYYHQWGHLNPGHSVEKEIERLQIYLNTEKIPLIVVGLEGDKFVGAAQLKFREMPQFPEKEHWLGGVYVAKAYRGRGRGAQIVRRNIEFAKSFGVQNLFLQTESLDGGLYKRLGWEPVEQVHHRGVDVLVMENRIGG